MPHPTVSTSVLWHQTKCYNDDGNPFQGLYYRIKIFPREGNHNSNSCSSPVLFEVLYTLYFLGKFIHALACMRRKYHKLEMIFCLSYSYESISICLPSFFFCYGVCGETKVVEKAHFAS